MEGDKSSHLSPHSEGRYHRINCALQGLFTSEKFCILFVIFMKKTGSCFSVLKELSVALP